MQIVALLNKMLIFVVMIAIGIIGARKKIFTQEFNRGISWVLLNVFLVATIANSIISTDVESYSVGEIGLALVVTSAVMILLFVISGVLIRILPVDPEKAPRLEMLMSITNTMFVSLPVAETFYGSKAVFILAISCIPFNALAYSYGLMRLRGTKEKISFKSIFSVPLIATVAATLIFILRIPVPRPLMSLFATVSGGTLPISMLLVGATLGGVSFSKAIRDRSMYLLSFVRFLLAPLLIWLVLQPFRLDPALANTSVIMAASPSAIIVTALSVRTGNSGEYTSEGVLFTTLLSIITLPITAYLIV